MAEKQRATIDPEFRKGVMDPETREKIKRAVEHERSNPQNVFELAWEQELHRDGVILPEIEQQ